MPPGRRSRHLLGRSALISLLLFLHSLEHLRLFGGRLGNVDRYTLHIAFDVKGLRSGSVEVAWLAFVLRWHRDIRMGLRYRDVIHIGGPWTGKYVIAFE